MKKLVVIALAALMALASCTKKTDESTSLDGTWLAARFEGTEDYAYRFDFKGNTLDLYVISYGWHFTGTYTYANNTVSYKITGAKCALSDVTFNEKGKIEGYSWMIGDLDAKTLKLKAGYDWYDMLLYREDLYEEYKGNYAQFTFKLTSSTTAESNIMGPAEKFIFNKQ